MNITDRPVFIFRQGNAPLLISLPHVGTYVPSPIAARMVDEARHVPDTDWHLETLYNFAEELDASMIIATHSRYVIDLNRPADGTSLYPGQSVTGLCPIDSFDGTPIYLPGESPDENEIAERRMAVWQPYHDKLEAEIARLKAKHGIAGLWDGHSIRSVLPRFFEGKLPDLNLGTANGKSCDEQMAQTVLQIAQSAKQDGFTSILNGRFTGGYITRHYGNPSRNVHAIQLEMTQSAYMQEELPFDYIPSAAAQIQPYIRNMVEAMLRFLQT